MDDLDFQGTLKNLGFTVLSADKASDIDNWPSFDELFGMITLPEDVMHIGTGETATHEEHWIVQRYHNNVEDWFKVEIGPGFLADFTSEKQARAAYDVMVSAYPSQRFRVLQEVESGVRISTVVKDDRTNPSP